VLPLDTGFAPTTRCLIQLSWPMGFLAPYPAPSILQRVRSSATGDTLGIVRRRLKAGATRSMTLPEGRREYGGSARSRAGQRRIYQNNQNNQNTEHGQALPGHIRGGPRVALYFQRDHSQPRTVNSSTVQQFNKSIQYSSQRPVQVDLVLPHTVLRTRYYYFHQ
jgi:hypothetical protein